MVRRCASWFCDTPDSLSHARNLPARSGTARLAPAPRPSDEVTLIQGTRRAIPMKLFISNERIAYSECSVNSVLRDGDAQAYPCEFHQTNPALRPISAGQRNLRLSERKASPNPFLPGSWSFP